MSIFEDAKNHWKGSGLRKIEVPEWANSAGEPAIIYFWPLNMKEKRKLKEMVDKGNTIEAPVDFLISKALDENGHPIFDPGKKLEIMSGMDPDVIERVAQQMMVTASAEKLRGE